MKNFGASGALLIAEFDGEPVGSLFALKERVRQCVPLTGEYWEMRLERRRS